MQQGITIMNVMPATFHLHLLNNVSKTGKLSVAQKLIHSVASNCIGFFKGMGIVTETCQGDLKDKLMELGCVPEGLPASVGGDWKYEEYTRWCRRKITEEFYFEELHLPSSKSESTRKMTAERKKERTKCLNVLHSRQKRERRKAEQSRMEEDCNQLQSEYFALKKENVRLTNLLSQAQRLVQQLEGNGYFPVATGMATNPTFDPIPSNVVSCTHAPVAFEPQTSMCMQQGNQLHDMLSTLPTPQSQSFAAPHSLSPQVMNQPLNKFSNAQLDNSIHHHSMNQTNNQMFQLGNNNQTQQAPMQNVNQPDMTQQFISQLLSNQHSTNQPGNPISQFAMDQRMQGSANQPTNMNLSVQQAMMQAMTMQNGVNSFIGQSLVQQGQSMNGDNETMLSSIQGGNERRLGITPTLSEGPTPTLPECSVMDPFAPINVHAGGPTPADAPVSAAFANMGSFIPDAPGPAPTSLRESVPHEFVGFDIPEPDPLPEPPSSVPPNHHSNFRQFFWGRG